MGCSISTNGTEPGCQADTITRFDRPKQLLRLLSKFKYCGTELSGAVLCPQQIKRGTESSTDGDTRMDTGVAISRALLRVRYPQHFRSCNALHYADSRCQTGT